MKNFQNYLKIAASVKGAPVYIPKQREFGWIRSTSGSNVIVELFPDVLNLTDMDSVDPEYLEFDEVVLISSAKTDLQRLFVKKITSLVPLLKNEMEYNLTVAKNINNKIKILEKLLKS